MSYTYKIVNAIKRHHIADNYDFLDVAYEIYNDKGDKVADFSDGFPVDTLEDPIREALKKKADWCEANDLKRIDEAERVKVDDGADKVIGALMADVLMADVKVKKDKK